LTLLVAAFVNAYSQKIDHWESIILSGDSCKYLVPESDIGYDWPSESFDDASWAKGKAGFGYGDNDDNTLLEQGTKCVYLRFSFNVQSKLDIALLYLDMDYDDGFVAYLNGKEVARANVSDPISWDMELDDIH
jgi:hypothetical protein